MGLETGVITNQEEFLRMKDEWNLLLNRCRTNTIFLTWEWLYSWWEVFGDGAELFIVAVRDPNGRLVGLAPLSIKRSQYYQLPVSKIAFIGYGLSDRQDFLVSNDASYDAVIQEIIRAVQRHANHWDVVLLDQIPKESALVTNDFVSSYCPERELSSLCPYVIINGAWNNYVRSLSKKFRKDIRNKMNNIDRLGNWELVVHENMDDFERLANIMGDIEEESAKKDSEKAFWARHSNREFLERFCARTTGFGWIDLSLLFLKDIPIAYLFGFNYNGMYLAYNTAYRRCYFEVSPGKLIMHEKIKWCFTREGLVSEFDFLRGDFYIKSLWASQSRQHLRIVFFKNSLYAQLLRLAVFRVRPALRKIWKKQASHTAPETGAKGSSDARN